MLILLGYMEHFSLLYPVTFLKLLVNRIFNFLFFFSPAKIFDHVSWSNHLIFLEIPCSRSKKYIFFSILKSIFGERAFHLRRSTVIKITGQLYGAKVRKKNLLLFQTWLLLHALFCCPSSSCQFLHLWVTALFQPYMRKINYVNYLPTLLWCHELEEKLSHS